MTGRWKLREWEAYDSWWIENSAVAHFEKVDVLRSGLGRDPLKVGSPE
jgi:hypothetical protein